MLDKTVHRRLASSCFHALGALASNSEETRRQITENSSLVCRLVDSIQLTQDTLTQDTENGAHARKYGELEEAFRRAEETGGVENIEQVFSNIKAEMKSASLLGGECEIFCFLHFPK
jgi:hypothetical protein